VIREVPRIVTRAWHHVSCPVVTIASYLQLMPFAGLLVEVGRPVADRSVGRRHHACRSKWWVSVSSNRTKPSRSYKRRADVLILCTCSIVPRCSFAAAPRTHPKPADPMPSF
jgi:hypothetical protein